MKYRKPYHDEVFITLAINSYTSNMFDNDKVIELMKRYFDFVQQPLKESKGFIQ